MLEGSISDEYERLEQIVQKQQAQLRRLVGVGYSYIQNELQLKLFNEALEQQIEESEEVRTQFLESTRLMISDLKRANQFLIEDNRRLKRHGEAALRASINRTETTKTNEYDTLDDRSRQRKKLQLMASSQLMRTEPSREKQSPRRAKLSVPRDMNELVDVKIALAHRYQVAGDDGHTQRQKKQYRFECRSSLERRSYRKSNAQSISFQELYGVKGLDIARQPLHRKPPKRRSLKKSSMSSRPDDYEVDTALKH